MRNETAFKIGDKVKAKVNAQGMVRGETYKVVDLITESNFTGRYTFYTLQEAFDGERFTIGNGHLLLEKVTS